MSPAEHTQEINYQQKKACFGIAAKTKQDSTIPQLVASFLAQFELIYKYTHQRRIEAI